MKSIRFFALILALLTAGTLSAATWYVDIAATGTNAGTSWTNAFHEMDHVSSNIFAGDTIFIRKGTYTLPVDFTTNFSSPASFGRYVVFIAVDDGVRLEPVTGGSGHWNGNAYEALVIQGAYIKVPAAYLDFFISSIFYKGWFVFKNCIITILGNGRLSGVCRNLEFQNCLIYSTAAKSYALYGSQALKIYNTSIFGGTTNPLFMFNGYPGLDSLIIENSWVDLGNAAYKFTDTGTYARYCRATNFWYNNLDTTGMRLGTLSTFRNYNIAPTVTGTWPYYK
jgi:hypothetical protein